MHLCTKDTAILFGAVDPHITAIGVSTRLRQILSMVRKLADDPVQRSATLSKALLPEHIYIYTYVYIDKLHPGVAIGITFGHSPVVHLNIYIYIYASGNTMPHFCNISPYRLIRGSFATSPKPCLLWTLTLQVHLPRLPMMFTSLPSFPTIVVGRQPTTWTTGTSLQT
jgi:hypothetical protein